MAIKKNFVTEIPEPAFARFFFANTRFSAVWLLLRLYIGWLWLAAGYEKLINPAWIGSHAGNALTGFVKGALQKSTGLHPDVSGWYANFLQAFVVHNAVAFSYLVTYGEIIVGVSLMLGIATGIAAFFGSFMNMNYLLAGTVSINPIMFVGELLLILAWRTAGWLGLDRFLLPLLGTPWNPGKLFSKK